MNTLMNYSPLQIIWQLGTLNKNTNVHDLEGSTLWEILVMKILYTQTI